MHAVVLNSEVEISEPEDETVHRKGEMRVSSRGGGWIKN